MPEAFVTTRIPPHAQDAIQQAQENFNSRLSPCLQMQKTQSFHLIIQPMGELPEDSLKEAEKLLHLVPETNIHLALSPDLGALPDVNHPQTIFANVEGGLNALTRLKHRINQTSERIPNPFLSHVPIGALSEQAGHQAKHALFHTRIPAYARKTWPVTGLQLTVRDGREHLPIAEIPWATGKGESAN